MNRDLGTLKEEILGYLESESFVVFHGFARVTSTESVATWDTDRRPDFRAFLETARQAGVKLVVFFDRTFSREMVEDARERLGAAELTGEERRRLERRLRELARYEGFTCVLELSFHHQGRVYMFHLGTDWFVSYMDLLDEINAALEEEPEDEDDEPLGDYYTRN